MNVQKMGRFFFKRRLLLTGNVLFFRLGASRASAHVVFGESSSVGFALRCGSVVSGILVVLWQEKVEAVESVKFDCLLMALYRAVIKRKLI